MAAEVYQTNPPPEYRVEGHEDALEAMRRVEAAHQRCRECLSPELSWEFVAVNRSGVGDKRLGLHDITPGAYLGCDECSATVALVLC